MGRRILITRAGSGQCNNLMRSLLHYDPSIELIGCNSDRFVLKRSPARRNFLIPAAGPDGDCSGALDCALRTVITRAGVDVLIPGNDDDALLLANIHERASLPCATFLTAAKTVALCQDKYALNVLIRKHDVPAAITYPVMDRASLFEAWAALAPRDLAWCRIRRGTASRGATMVGDADQAWHWIDYWNRMRGVPVTDFTLCEFLPGRDLSVQGIWWKGRLVLIKMCERLAYLNASQSPSGMASTPALAKTVWEPKAIEACEAALNAIDPSAHGVFFFDLKENEDDIPCITEINAGRFAMSTNIYDLVGRHNMAGTYVRLACGEAVQIEQAYDYPGEYYLVREPDALPCIFTADELFKDIEIAGGSAER